MIPRHTIPLPVSSDPIHDDEREAAIAAIAVQAREVADRVVRSRSGSLSAEDAADVVSTVMLRLVRRIRSAELRHEAIANLDDFVATLTYNTLYDTMRRRFPERTRLKNRLRYVLSRDERLAMWNGSAGVIAGLAQWRGATQRVVAFTLSSDDATDAMLDRDATGDALVAILTYAGRPVLLDDLVAVTAELWNVAEVEVVAVTNAAESENAPMIDLERRQYLDTLWREIRELRAPQRAALLLNLRDSDGHNAVALLMLVGTGTFADIAAAMEMTPQQLGEIWDKLPMSDLTIADTLGVSRQQVINLRRSARERLARRMDAATQWSRQ